MTALPERSEGDQPTTLDAYAAEKSTDWNFHRRARIWSMKAQKGELPLSESSLDERLARLNTLD
jgi:hypothetical protein